MANKHMKRCSTSLVIREVQIKATRKYYFTLTRMVKVERSDDTKHRQTCGVTLMEMALHILGFCSHRFNQPWIKKIFF